MDCKNYVLKNIHKSLAHQAHLHLHMSQRNEIWTEKQHRNIYNVFVQRRHIFHVITEINNIRM